MDPYMECYTLDVLAPEATASCISQPRSSYLLAISGVSPSAPSNVRKETYKYIARSLRREIEISTAPLGLTIPTAEQNNKTKPKASQHIMKLNLALTLFASFGVTVFADSTYYSKADFGDSTDAAAFCGDKGQVLATTQEWCDYATANSGVLYGTAAAADADGCVDVEDVCGIPKPTDAPTKAPTAAPVSTRTIIRNRARITPSRGRSSSFRTTSGAIGRSSRGFGRNLESICPEQTSVLCSPAPEPLPAPKKASGSGDPHLKTWTGDKYDYHGVSFCES